MINKRDINKLKTPEDLERKYNLSDIFSLKENYELQKTGLNKVENELNNFIKITTDNLKELQDQVDGNITTWFYSGVPTESNEPASEWTTTDEKNNHLGDLYYDKETGYAYRYSLENDVYNWIKITDNDVTKALAIANSAKDVADSKRRVFVVEPTTPYDCGDLWIKDEELYRCQTSKTEIEPFEENDWIIATKYTDDTVANQVGKNLTILSGTVTEIREDVDSLTNTMTNTTKLVDEQGNTIENLQEKQSETSQTVDEISSSIETINNQITPTSIVSGENIHIEDGSDNDMISLKLDGMSKQETRSGKNLLYWTRPTFGTIVENEDGSFVWSYPYAYNLSMELTEKLEAGTYTISNYGDITLFLQTSTDDYTTSVQSNGSKTFTYDGTSYLRLLYSATTPNTPQLFKLQLEQGSSATDYEAYGISPSPDYPSEIKNVGYENVFDSENWYNILHSIDTLSMTKEEVNGVEYYKVRPSGIYKYEYMKGQFKENTQYTISAKARKYDNVSRDSTGFAFAYTDGTTSYSYVAKTLEEYDYMFTSDPNKTIDHIGLSYYYHDYVLMRDIILVEDLEPRAYVPFGKYGVEVDDIGKNLLPDNWMMRDTTYVKKFGEISTTSQLTTSYLYGGSTNFINLILEPSTYTFSASSETFSNLYVVINNNGTIENWANGTTKKFTNNVTIQAIRCNEITLNAGTYNWIAQIEQGSSATDYEPYKCATTLFTLNEPLRSLPNGTKDELIVQNGIAKVIKRVGKFVLEGVNRLYAGTLFDVEGQFAGYEIKDVKERGRNYNFISDKIRHANETFGDYAGYLNQKTLIVMTTLDNTLDNFNSNVQGAEVIYELEQEKIIELGEVEQPKTYQDINNISNSAETNMTIEYVRDTILSDYVEGQIGNAIIIQERKNAEFQITNNEIKSSVSEVSTKLNNDYTNNQELNQKLEEQKQTITEEYSTLITQTKESWQASVINYINQNGVEKFVNTLVTIDIDGLKLSKSDEDIVSLLNNKGLYVSDGKLREDLINLLMKVDRAGALFKLLEVLGTIKEQEIIQKEKITDDTYGECQAWYWIGE